MTTNKVCSVEGCEKPYYARGTAGPITITRGAMATSS